MSKDKGTKNVKKAPGAKTLKTGSDYKNEGKVLPTALNISKSEDKVLPKKK
jgi:hypothetical protein